MATPEQITLLFIHGAGGTQSKWRKVHEQITHVHSKFIDLPGHGTHQGRPAASIEEYAEMLNPAIDQDCIVVGHSMGGLIGIELAAKNGNVKGLVLTASHFSLPVHPTVISALAEGTFPERLFYASYSKKVNSELLEQEKIEISHVPIATTVTDYDCCNRYLGGLETLSNLNIPVLALYGEEDRLLPKTAKEDLLNANSHVQARVIEGSGHYIMLEKPEEFVSALLQFKDSIEKRGG